MISSVLNEEKDTMTIETYISISTHFSWYVIDKLPPLDYFSLKKDWIHESKMAISNKILARLLHVKNI